MRKYSISLIGLFIFIFSSIHLAGQAPMHSTYYYQKKSHFEQMPNTKKEIIFLGDSITDGCEWSEVFGNKKIKNRGISGDVTQGVLDRLEEVTESHPRKVFLMIGINDLARGVTTGKVIKNIHDIIQHIREASPKTEIFIQSLLPVNDSFGKFDKHVNKTEAVLTVNVALQKMAGKQVTYIDLHQAFANEDGKLDSAYTNDGLHLNGAGYSLWVAEIQRFVGSWLL